MTLMGLIVTVMAAVVSVSLRTLPTTEQRADSAVNVQGLVTWLPTDVDSTEPGQFDVLSSTASGCAGVDPGRNLLRLRWQETLLTVTTNFVANYRYVPQPDGGGRIFRLTCSGQASLGAPISLSMTGLLPDWVVGDEPVEVLTYDSDGDARDDLITFKVTNLNGGEIFAEAATKNPTETSAVHVDCDRNHALTDHDDARNHDHDGGAWSDDDGGGPHDDHDDHNDIIDHDDRSSVCGELDDRPAEHGSDAQQRHRSPEEGHHRHDRAVEWLLHRAHPAVRHGCGERSVHPELPDQRSVRRDDPGSSAGQRELGSRSTRPRSQRRLQQSPRFPGPST